MPVVKKQSTATPTNGVRTNLFDAALPVQELPETGYKFLFFGMSGVGKTSLACTLPRPLLLIRPEEVEDGSLSVRQVPGVSATPFFRTPDDISDVIQGQAATGKYKTLVLDGVGKFQSLVIRKHMGWEELPMSLTWGMVPQQDWGLINVTTLGYLRDLFRLAEKGTHIVIVGGERTMGGRGSEEQAVQEPTVMIDVSPAVSKWLHEVSDYNLHLFVRQKMVEKLLKLPNQKEPVKKQIATDELEFCAHVKTDVVYKSKFRCDKNAQPPAIAVNLDYEKILSLIRGEQVVE